jgi:hypothetical protein
MYYLQQSNPQLRKPADYESDINSLIIGGLFAFAFAVFFVARNGAETPVKKSICNAFMWVSSIPMLLFGVINPLRLGIALPDLNGRPVTGAGQLGPLFSTAIEIAVIGEFTKKRTAAKNVIWWNNWVYIFGALAGITEDPISHLFAWFAVGSYAISLHLTEEIFEEASSGLTGALMGKNTLWLTKLIWYATNHACIESI